MTQFKPEYERFIAKLKQFDRRLDIKFVRGGWRFYRVGKYIFTVDRLDNRVFEKLREIDAWRHPDFLKKMDRHNESLDEAHERKAERVSEHVADRLTQRHY